MTLPLESAGGLSRSEKAELLRKVLVEKISQTRTVPASFAQERLWFLERMHPAGGIYGLRMTLRLAGPVDHGALERALGEIVRRHEALRTTFAEVDGCPVQRIAPFEGFALPVDTLPEGDAAALRNRVARECDRPFDLAEGPLFRALLLRVGVEEHVLLLGMHHIVSDGWSLGVIFRELSALYAAFREGRASPLGEPALQYADYAQRQRDLLRDGALDRHLAYWRARLADAPALLELPADHPRPAVRTYRGASRTVAFSPSLRERLEALGRGEGATLYMVLLAAFQVLLSRYGGGTDVVVGSPVAGRDRRDEEALVGFFVNTLVMRTDLSGDPGFREALRRVRAVTLGAYEHQAVPFEKLVAELRPERSLGHSPLFQVMLALETDGLAGEAPVGLEPLRLDPDGGTSRFDLSLVLEAHAGGIGGTVEYSTDLFEPATIDRMLRHLERVLEQVVDDPDQPISALELADAAERRLLLEGWSGTEAGAPDPRAIHAIFEEQAARTPDAVAVVCGDDALTYRALNERANRLAHHLAALGVGLESRVGLCLERGSEMVAATLAVLKAGGAYVPLDPAYPAERLAFMLADSAVAVLLTEASLRDALPAHDGVRIVSIDGDGEQIARESAENPRSAAGAGTLAYVMYTSGSTGTPRGVAVEHRSVVRLVRGARYVKLGPDEAILQAAPVSFDAATFEIWGALLNGGRLVLVPGITPSLEELGRTVARHGVTTMWLAAGLFQAMVEQRPDDLAGVRQLLAGGDVLPVDAVRRLRERVPSA
ncbi:MAG TPA: condensation domain-containing protein, partial [Longimicrobium sp.]|nr:condensation domain-containing protein [Longimicrobium sp.]